MRYPKKYQVPFTTFVIEDQQSTVPTSHTVRWKLGIYDIKSFSALIILIKLGLSCPQWRFWIEFRKKTKKPKNPESNQQPSDYWTARSTSWATAELQTPHTHSMKACTITIPMSNIVHLTKKPNCQTVTFLKQSKEKTHTHGHTHTRTMWPRSPFSICSSRLSVSFLFRSDCWRSFLCFPPTPATRGWTAGEMVAMEISSQLMLHCRGPDIIWPISLASLMCPHTASQWKPEEELWTSFLVSQRWTEIENTWMTLSWLAATD